MTEQELNALREWIIDNRIATEDEVDLVTDINGYTEFSLNEIISARTEYNDYPQIMSLIPDEYESDILLDSYYCLDEEEDDED